MVRQSNATKKIMKTEQAPTGSDAESWRDPEEGDFDGDFAASTIYSSSSVKEGDGEDEVKKVEMLAKKETRRINVTRFLVMSMLLAAGVGIALGTYKILTDSEDDKYNAAVSSSTKSLILTTRREMLCLFLL